MQKSVFKIALCIVIIAIIAALATACSTQPEETPQTPTTVTETIPVQNLGEGEKQFTFTVTDADGNEANFLIKTDKTLVGEALEELNLIAGDKGPYGLYVKRVNGITLDYDKDGMYWAFYINGEMAMSGVDTTEIVENATYSFKAAK